MKGPATAVEALRGLVRVRPHGWLTAPLPTGPAAVADLLHATLDTHAGHPAAGGPLNVLAARATTAVASLGDPPRSILKLHADSDAHNDECVAYALVGASPVLPRLLNTDDASRSLLLEYIPHPYPWTAHGAAAAVVDAVAAVHAAPDLLDAAAAGAFAAFRLDRLTAAPAPRWLPEPAAWADVLDRCLTAYGGHRIPVGHLDLKPEHVRLRDNGDLVLLDVETLRPDITGLIDLITLPAVLRQAAVPLPGPDVLALYQDASRRHGIGWTTDLLRDALIAYQRATGLATLDELADSQATPTPPVERPVMEPTPASLALVRVALDALGVDGPPKHLSGRKGANVWRAGNWTVKTAVPGARGHLGHEIAAYGLLHDQGLHPGAQHGDTDGAQWLAVPWIDGRSVWEIFAPARAGQTTDDQRATMRDTARAALAALQQLHAREWIHGDMQVENVVLTHTGAIEFIDLDSAHHPDLPLGHPYRGGLIHVIAPELAQLLLDSGEEQHVPLTPSAELFALGASLYWAWTGHRITNYRGDPAGVHTDLYADITAGRRRDLRADRPWTDPEMERLILRATLPAPESRSYRG